MNLLFICSMNQRRSLTAEHHFAGRSGLDVRSAGTARRDERAITSELIAWADVICVMDQRHLDWITERFGEDVLDCKLARNLSVADEYHYGDPALIALLDDRLSDVLGNRT